MMLVAGEVLVDLIVRPDDTVSVLGGGPFNTARALARLGVNTAFLGRVSTDVFGKRVIETLQHDHVSLEAVIPTEDLTTMALVEINASGGASYRFYLEATSVPGCTPQQAKAALANITDPNDPIVAFHVGTLALVLEPFAQACEELVEQLSAQNNAAPGNGTPNNETQKTLIVVDPNIRPIAIHDRDRYLQRLHRVLSHANVVKVSDEDLIWIDPAAANDLEAGARRLIALGAELVLVTSGGDGVLVVTQDQATTVATPKVTVVDTIGAGDTFTAGVLSWWHDHDRPSLAVHANALEATRRGCDAAAYVVQQVGANPPHRTDLMLT
jgi:fructokinase